MNGNPRRPADAPTQPREQERTATSSAPKLRRFMRLPEVREATGLTTSTLYAMMQAGAFPRGIQITGRRLVAWLEDDIAAWQAARIAENKKS